MFLQDVICPSISFASCYWCLHSFDASSFGCLRQDSSCSDDPLSVVCPFWLDDSFADLSISDLSVQDPPKAGELASA